MTFLQLVFEGYGAFAAKPIRKGQFCMEYKGELITIEEANRREASYAEELGSYLYRFSVPEKLSRTVCAKSMW